MVTTIEKPRVKEKEQGGQPKFRDPSTMTKEELSDPDYRLKRIFGADIDVHICSKCHHCR